ncbi:MAG: ATP-binding protein, partial [Acidimicrobiia bacterium]
GMGGFELISTMLQDETLRSVPVILCSAYFSAAESRAVADELGVAAVVPKPFDAMTMFAAIDRAISAPRATGGRRGPEAALRALNRKLIESLDRVEVLTVERRHLLARVVRDQADERTKLAADVHDDAIQVMLAAALELESMERVVHDDVLLLRCTAVVAEIRGAAGRLRDVLAGLPSTVPEGVTLAEAVRALGTRHPFETQVTDHLDFAPEEAVFLTLYRVAQEALTNVAKHAAATRVEVSIAGSEGGVRLCVRDDGRGCSPSLLNDRPGHLGMMSMHERAKIAGGWCRVDSRVGAGTTVEAWVPGTRG